MPSSQSSKVLAWGVHIFESQWSSGANISVFMAGRIHREGELGWRRARQRELSCAKGNSWSRRIPNVSNSSRKCGFFDSRTRAKVPTRCFWCHDLAKTVKSLCNLRIINVDIFSLIFFVGKTICHTDRCMMWFLFLFLWNDFLWFLIEHKIHRYQS